ncbi:PREDICTED: uncharacterized protein LOC108569884 [Nicrophorus vespilloides]|uniref:Uncharacterized protein LOC108569884 n=1 Tax=Nicrophorus vespilloides TaxID=110193 RepID=A0ABM1NJX0_NICVS|nr:PREDICTED: uncharacterized protein LOC108569884 [Nicrophorus vespilloides]
MSGTKRRTLTIGEKIEIISAIEQGTSNSSISKRLNLSSSTISTIWKKKDIIINAFEKNKCNLKKLRTTEKNDLEEALLSWFKIQKEDNMPISATTFKQHAESLASELGSTGEVVVESVIPDNMILRDEPTHIDDRSVINEEPSMHESLLASVNVEITEGSEENNNPEFIKQELSGITEAQTALETLTFFYETNNIDPQFLKHLHGLKEIVQKMTK